jgi:gas vesicle protein
VEDFEVSKEVKIMRKLISFLVGLLAGAIVGGAGALLLTPYKGEDLQDQIRARIQELLEEGQRATAIRQTELENQLETFKRGQPITIETAPDQPSA